MAKTMNKTRKGCGCLLLGPLLAVALVWIGTRNLSNTRGSEIVARAEACRKPNNDFTYSTNPSIERAACRNYPVTGSFHPLTCINTATSFYNPKATCSYCPDFVRMPGRWNFREVPAKERKPGDLIIFYRKGIASHAAVYIGESLFGPLMNQSTGDSSRLIIKSMCHTGRCSKYFGKRHAIIGIILISRSFFTFLYFCIITENRTI